MDESSTLDVIRYDAAGRRIPLRSVQMGSSTRPAPFRINGRFGDGEEVWLSTLVYADGVVLMDVQAAPRFVNGVQQSRTRKVFLIYADEEAAADAGWRS